MHIHVVQKGDTVYGIARRYGVSPNRIILDNMLTEPDKLTPGQALLVLIPKILHKVIEGETITGIASFYNITPLKILQNNPHLTLNPFLHEGDTVVITFDGETFGAIMTSGFAYDFINPDVLEAALPYLTYLIIFGYGFDENGEIITLNDEKIISLAHAYRTAVLLSLTTINRDGTFGSSKVERVLIDINFQNKVIAGMLNEIKTRGAQGMDIDMEYIPPHLRLEYVAFIKNATDQLNAQGYIVHVDLAPKTSSEQKGTLYEAHDYALIGKAANYVFLMTYEWGYTYRHL